MRRTGRSSHIRSRSIHSRRRSVHSGSLLEKKGCSHSWSRRSDPWGDAGLWSSGVDVCHRGDAVLRECAPGIGRCVLI